MAIVQDDYQYSETNSNGSPIPFGTAGDCYSASQNQECRKGGFMIDLTGTGLKVKDNVEWTVKSETPGMKISGFKNDKGLQISAKCGGWCGQCLPKSSLRIELVRCNMNIGKFLHHAILHYVNLSFR